MYTQQKKFMDTSKSQIFPEMFHIRLIKGINHRKQVDVFLILVPNV